MRCDKAKQCNVCDGWFKMERGCLLEKRCPSCRELNLTKSMIKTLGERRVFQEATAYSVTNSGKEIKKPLLHNLHESVLAEYMEYETTPIKNEVEASIKREIGVKILELLKEILNGREFTVVCMTFGLNDFYDTHTLEEISKEIGVTRERVRQIQSSAIKKLKHPREMRRLVKSIFGEGATRGSEILEVLKC